MSGFTTEWLALREPADHRSRNPSLQSALSSRLSVRASIDVVDLGCGTGSNLRATAPLLGPRQSWTLVDHDPRLLSAARDKLSHWAGIARGEGEALYLEKDGKEIWIRFRQADLAKDLDRALGEAPALVTASALFDLASVEFIRRFASSLASRRAAFYTVLTYNGIQHWSPRHPSDNALTAAFHRHQMTDKGFGVSAGPTAPAHLADQFRLEGYLVEEGDSPWVLTGARDAALVGELAKGFLSAVRETRAVDARTLDAWERIRHTGAEVGHTDTLAFPG